MDNRLDRQSSWGPLFTTRAASNGRDWIRNRRKAFPMPPSNGPKSPALTPLCLHFGTHPHAPTPIEIKINTLARSHLFHLTYHESRKRALSLSLAFSLYKSSSPLACSIFLTNPRSGSVGVSSFSLFFVFVFCFFGLWSDFWGESWCGLFFWGILFLFFFLLLFWFRFGCREKRGTWRGFEVWLFLVLEFQDLFGNERGTVLLVSLLGKLGVFIFYFFM